MLYALLVTALIVLDQVVKALVRTNIPLYTAQPLLPGFLELTHVRNTGAAFSILSAHTWVLTLISAAVSLVLAAALIKRVVRHPFGLTALSLVLAGAVGNLIDRALQGYVTDMFNFQFMRFAVFNVADICVVTGGIATCVYLLFFYEKLEKRPLPGQEHDGSTDADG
ncbi:Lipoprotein signal peptidase [bioreactor metagenome]|uniref:Lipoprotein signal peptidase n=1 Tax=bioreactor metagenome TaxID=1076179 RepID=A0A645C1H0_9ZZZZ